MIVTTTKTSAIFLTIVLLVGIFTAIYLLPFVIGVKAQIKNEVKDDPYIIRIF